ncbi:MAG: M23 family metallopeptidase [Treponema sp.]|nr:M23 family metallopeptidase [Treponema sp.]
MNIIRRLTALNTKRCIATICCLALVSLCASADTSYTVKRGDTLYSISRNYQITVAELCAANNISETGILKAGQKLIIPNADIGTAAALSQTPVSGSGADARTDTTYIVQKGDTLYGIARRHNMPLSELVALNGITGDILKAGQKLVVRKADAPGTEQKNAAPAIPKDGAALVWPVTHTELQNITGKISGVKLFTRQSEPVKAVRSGTVMYVGSYRGFGKVVFVESKTGLIYAYTWLSEIAVQKGDYVVYGDTLGTTGRDTETGKPTVTFMVFQNGMPVDPSRAPRG